MVRSYICLSVDVLSLNSLWSERDDVTGTYKVGRNIPIANNFFLFWNIGRICQLDKRELYLSRYSYGLWAGSPKFDSQKSKTFFLFHSFQIDSGAHPASYPVGPGALSPGVRRKGREADHSPQSSAKVNEGAIPALSHVFSCHCA
jgi:hypothetical protein